MNMEQERHADFCTFAVNRFGSGRHPVARVETLRHFTDDYIATCVRKAVADRGTTAEGVTLGYSYLRRDISFKGQ